MKTDDLITSLAADLKPTRGADSAVRFAARASLGTVALLGVALWVLPFRSDLPIKLSSARFLGEGCLWLACAALSARAAYASAIPSLPTRGAERAAKVALALLAGLIVSGVSIASLGADVMTETDVTRGWCGPLILLLGAIGAAGLFLWARRHAATDYRRAGFWIAASAASLGAFAMQFVCAHDTAAHLALWHAVPTALLAWLGASAGSRLLRW